MRDMEGKRDRERARHGETGRAGEGEGMKCGVASRYCRRLQIKYPISLFGTNQPIHSPPSRPRRPPRAASPSATLTSCTSCTLRAATTTNNYYCRRVRPCA